MYEGVDCDEGGVIASLGGVVDVGEDFLWTTGQAPGAVEDFGAVVGDVNGELDDLCIGQPGYIYISSRSKLVGLRLILEVMRQLLV